MFLLAILRHELSHENKFRLATQKFMKLVNKFVREVKQQMGVEIFMLAGYRDSKGNLRKSK